jgi:hypothetical protein
MKQILSYVPQNSVMKLDGFSSINILPFILWLCVKKKIVFLLLGALSRVIPIKCVN